MKLGSLLYHYLVPHEHNNHRARALHHESLFAYVLLLVIFNLSITRIHKQAPDILGYATDIRIEKLLEATNTKRQEQGLGQLSLNQTLSQAAQNKAADMFANGYWAHNSPQGKTPWDFILSAGYRYSLAGENLAKNFDTSAAVVDAWMASPTHRDNILKGGYTEVGFAIVNGVLLGEETTLVVQMFGTGTSNERAQIPQVQAKEPIAVQVPQQPAALAMEASAPAAARVAKTQNLPFVGGVHIAPLVDIPAVTHQVAYMFVGLIVGVLAVDAFVVWRKRLVRLTGHTIAHILFLFVMIAGSLSITRGSLL